MPNIASAKKRMRQNELQRVRNRASRSRLRGSLRILNEAIAAGDMDVVQARWLDTQALLDRTAQNGVIHRNQAARTKSRLSRRIQHLSAS